MSHSSPTVPWSPPPQNGPGESLPRQFGRYKLVDVLGEGGMGKVYKAHDPHFETFVAVKVPHAEIIQHPGLLDRFYREARALAKLTHPSVCRVFDVNQVSGQHYLVMAYVEGRPLSRADAPSPRAAADLVRTLALTLAEIHEQGVVHRDLKPSNILIDKKGRPIIMDFGLVLDLDAADERTRLGQILGTVAYMAPEQARGNANLIGPACDVYSLGVLLFQLLTDHRPFDANTQRELIWLVGDLDLPAPAPSTLDPQVDPALDAICAQALAKRIETRFADMQSFANALRDYLTGASGQTQPAPTRAGLSGKLLAWLRGRAKTALPAPAPTTGAPTVSTAKPLPLKREVIRFEFVGHGSGAPRSLVEHDKIYLDVGNDLRSGVIDHHHLPGLSTSTAGLVLSNPGHLAAAVKRWRQPADPFTLTLHEDPDLDGLSAAYLAISWLTTGAFPPGTEVLTSYINGVDAGSVGMDPARPYGLYAAYAQLKHRLGLSTWENREDLWRECVLGGLRVVEFVLHEASAKGIALPEVDAFRTPGLFSHLDRREVQTDLERYESKLGEPACRARRVTIRLQGRLGGVAEVPALLVRDVQIEDDPDRCVFFRDWARADVRRCPRTHGFVALVVFQSESSSGRRRRCILSVRPGAEVTLKGLGALLDKAEGARRKQLLGFDDRVEDTKTRSPLEPRTGYDNADPWYDGRGHQDTIVDSPRSGTRLTAEEIEALFLEFAGRGAADLREV